MSFDLGATLRRLKPQKRTAPLSRRADEELSFVGAAPLSGPALLLDTSVYIDALQGRLPARAKQVLAVRQISHSSVAVAELSHVFGRLDPRHPGTAATLAQIEAVVRDVPPHRLTGPSVRNVIEAGIITGVIARLRGLPRTRCQPLFNDACLFLQAQESGLVLLTRNIADMDLIQQLAPSGRMLLYRQSA